MRVVCKPLVQVSAQRHAYTFTPLYRQSSDAPTQHVKRVARFRPPQSLRAIVPSSPSSAAAAVSAVTAYRSWLRTCTMTPSASVVSAGPNDTALDPDAKPAVDIKQPPAQAQNGRTCRRIQVSRDKRPVHFFVALAKKFLISDFQIELSGLGLAVVNVVTIAEHLREAGIASIEDIQTSLVEATKGNLSTPKAKIQIWLTRIDGAHQQDNCTNNQVESSPEHAGDTNPRLDSEGVTTSRTS
ncbi:unnamed protein product [Agarophyton chilense]